ncbi:MAG TPA: sensor histidine kinase KdpD, partial [Devosia sp.]|nr:sensor histidine kinase KdpD [Devosia sp.]
MRDDADKRPDPAVLLQLAARETRGKLTVFLGAAPGVGKTYAMLERARGLKDAGTDVVIGLVETHGRSDTARLAEGIEVLPRQNNGGPYGEFDLDAALIRRPALLIVDELAHTNAPGSRHPKRYQDIAELIGAGIDVWTALNIQHLESLSDLVARIAGIPVRETVPDVVLKRADEVILVDLPPAELIARLNAGKVYLPDNARRALDGFFKPATLTALRELALRRAADRVDDQMVDFLRQSAVEGPWATGERLLVCVGPDAISENVVRVASRLASGLNARWLVVSLTRPGSALPAPAEAEQL